MIGEKFLAACEKNDLTLEVNYFDYTLSITGENKLAERARRKLDNSRELTASVLVALAKTDALLMDLLTERAAIRGADGLPDDLYSAALASIQESKERIASIDKELINKKLKERNPRKFKDEVKDSSKARALAVEVKAFKDECVKHSIYGIAGYDDFDYETPRVWLSVNDFHLLPKVRELTEYLRARPELERALHADLRLSK